MDIIVTTPKSEMANAAREAEDAKSAGSDTMYFRRLSSMTAEVEFGDRLYYVEDGYLRGFCIVERIERRTDGQTCDTTGRTWEPGTYVYMRADSWCWIAPIPIQGFRGWRYAPKGMRDSVSPVGGWMDPKPESGAGSASK